MSHSKGPCGLTSPGTSSTKPWKIDFPYTVHFGWSTRVPGLGVDLLRVDWPPHLHHLSSTPLACRAAVKPAIRSARKDWPVTVRVQLSKGTYKGVGVGRRRGKEAREGLQPAMA